MSKENKNKIDLNIIWYFFRNYKFYMFIVFGFICVSGILEMINLTALYPVMNYGLEVQNTNFLMNVYNAMIELVHIGTPFQTSCIFLIIISVFALLFKLACYYATYSLMIMVVGKTQKNIFEKLVSADYDFFVKTQQGKLIYTGTTATEHASALVLSVLRFTYDFINSLFLLLLLMFLSWKGTTLLLVIGLAYGIFVKKIINKIIHHSAEISAIENRSKNVILNEFINGIKVIKIFSVFEEWRKKFVHAVDRSLKYQLKMLMGRAYPEVLGKAIFYLLLASVGIFMSKQVGPDLVKSLPLYGTFVIVASRFFPAMQLVGNDFVLMAGCMPNTRMVYELCEQKVESHEDGSRELEHFKKSIVFNNATFKYSQMTDYILKGVTFSINKNEITAIVGLSGAGKTTIINLLLKLYRLDEGEIKLDGININEFRADSYFKKIGYVSQDMFIFNDTIKENIRFGMDNCTNEMIENAARIANAHEFIVNTDNGYETVVGDAGIKLSGGQKQRIAIARAMLRKPEIIVFDEATSSLDNISEKKIQDAINNISKNTTVLVVAHRLSTVKDANKIIVLDNGKVVEQGTNDELLENKGAYFNIYIAQG